MELYISTDAESFDLSVARSGLAEELVYEEAESFFVLRAREPRSAILWVIGLVRLAGHSMARPTDQVTALCRPMTSFHPCWQYILQLQRKRVYSSTQKR